MPLTRGASPETQNNALANLRFGGGPHGGGGGGRQQRSGSSPSSGNAVPPPVLHATAAINGLMLRLIRSQAQVCRTAVSVLWPYKCKWT
eukprot:scaffold100145_cov35-Prasinocladus_malaysianus.AAC.1